MNDQLFEKELSREYPFKGKIFDVAVCAAELPDGTKVRRDVVCHSGGVCVIAIDENGMVPMVRQYRYGVSDVTLEIPAGKLEKGEDPLEAIRRELSEETGYTADEIIPLHIDYSSPAMLSEIIYIYLARGLHGGKQHLDEDEFLEVEKYSLSELVDMVMDGKITDGKTQIAVLKAARMIEDIYCQLQRAICVIRTYCWSESYRNEEGTEQVKDAAVRYLRLAKRILPLRQIYFQRVNPMLAHSTPVQEETLLYCIDTLLELLDEGDYEKIASFADAIHNIPEYFATKKQLTSWDMRVEFSGFEKRYGKAYLAKVWDLHQPNRKRGLFRK